MPTLQRQILLLSLLMGFAHVSLAEVDLATIEAEERQRIITELSWRLNTRQVCEQTPNWQDSGSGADLDGYFFIPVLKKSEYMIGGHVSQKSRSKFHCVTAVSEAESNPKTTPPLLVKPSDWKIVWDDKGSGATKDGSIWQAIPPDDNYRCIGAVSQLGHGSKPRLSNYRCVHKSLTQKISTSAIIWSDKGSGANRQVTIFGLPDTGVYAAVPKRANNIETYNLRKNVNSVPDAMTVDAILAERMAPIKADIEAKAKAKIEQEKLAAAEAEAKKRKAAAAEKKRKEEAEKKRLADEAEQARLAVEAEQEAEQVVKEVVTEQEVVKQETVNQEPIPVIEIDQELIPDFPDDTISSEEPVAETTEVTKSDESEPKAKGLDHLVTSFLKILGLMFGGLILLLIIFKVLFGKKAPKED